MIQENLTFEEFGYYPDKLKPKSGKKIVAMCDKCGKLRLVRKGQYRPFCRACSHHREGGYHFAKNRMYCFEKTYADFQLKLCSWEAVVREINKKAKAGNPYAIDIWHALDDFSYSEKVHNKIDVYFDFFNKMKKSNLIEQETHTCSQCGYFTYSQIL